MELNDTWLLSEPKRFTTLLSFHPDKCKVMHIGPGDKQDYYINGRTNSQLLQHVDNEKDIGVIFDAQLEFDKHINDKINKANSIFSMILRSYKYLHKESFLPLYKALVRSNLEYANTVWSPYKLKYSDAIEKVQKRATRSLPELKGLSYEERLKVLKLPTLVYRRLRGDMIEVYKITSGIYDTDVVPKLAFRQNDNIRGHSKTLMKTRANKKPRSNSFTLRVVNTWNSLPESVVSAPSLNAFKNRLDKLWQHQEVKYSYKATLSIGCYYQPFDVPDEDMVVVIEDLVVTKEDLVVTKEDLVVTNAELHREDLPS